MIERPDPDKAVERLERSEAVKRLELSKRGFGFPLERSFYLTNAAKLLKPAIYTIFYR
jgi:hypothetical protein